ncbi:sugar ABC transporter ATP-binding protein [Nocardia fusca]|uniref:sugar ABC transporter ATP-binding protein n=1 Tax=Nocardia fusca TaxID=941183 RepID=UPI0037C756FB
MSATTGAALACDGIVKAFNSVPVLRGVSLDLRPGTITALAGENGAGKSTLMKIAAGQYHPDDGQVSVHGQVLRAGDPQEAYRLGVGIVPQELASIPEMTVYENLFLGREIHRAGLLDRRAMARRARESLEPFGLDLDPLRKVGELSVGVQQIIEIAKATSRGARVLLLDEPTSAIAKGEVARFGAVLRQLRADGVAVLFTTHKMEEIRDFADRVVVLRDGELVTDVPLTGITDDEIVTAMVGRELGTLFPPVAPHSEEIVLEVRDLVVDERPPAQLTVRRGEIVGLAGLMGAGRTELLETIFGMRTPRAGTIAVKGNRVRPGNPAASIVAKMVFVPEDRKRAGAIMGMSILDNATLPHAGAFSTAGYLSSVGRARAIGKVMDGLRLRRHSLAQPVETLSGGNQQKVVLGRWLTADVDVLLLDEPTRGVDVGARNEIYKIITQLAERGMAVVMASSDMPEVVSLTHRVLVMHAGRFAGELDREQLGRPDVQDRIFRFASGDTDRISKEFSS